MNLYQFISTVKQIALAHKDVNTFNEGDVYEIMNSGQHTYPATVLTINNITTNEQSHYQTINCVLFYIDRLTDDNSNKTMIMSQGFNVLKQIKDKAVESIPWSFETANYTPYTEKFGDLCAGVYLECTIELEDDVICSDTSYVSQQLDVTRNGLYSTIGYDSVLVSVNKPVLQHIDITANGTYTPDKDVDGFDSVNVNVPDPELEELNVTKNGTYIPTKYGYSKVDVNVPEQKPEQTKTVTINQNGTTEIVPDEGSVLSKVDVNVNVPDPELEELNVTANGTYTPTKYGYSKVDVAVPATPTQEKEINIEKNNQTLEVLPDEGYDLSKVSVGVHIPQEYPTISINQNGSTKITPTGTDALIKSAVVNVNVPSKPEQTKTVTINQNGTTEIVPDEGSVLSKVDVTVNVAGGGGGDLFGFDAIGYDGTEQNLKDDVAYSKQIYDNWDPSTTSMYTKFANDTKLVYMPKVDTSNVTNMQGAFHNCTSLTTLPILNTSNVTNMAYVSGRYPSYFLYGTKITKLPAWDLRKVFNIESAFYNSKLQSFDFDMPALKNADFAFKYCSDLKTVNITNAAPLGVSDMFSYCSSLIQAPMLDTSKVTHMGVFNSNFDGVFKGCTSLIEAPNWNTSNVTAMDYMFSDCSSLTTVPQYDTSKVTNMQYMFSGCTSLITLPQLDASKATQILGTVYQCTSLTNFGGLLNVGQALTSSTEYWLASSPLLTDESIQNVIDGLYDMTAKGFSPTLKFHTDVYAKLTEEQKAQITAKNWTVSA